MENLKILEVREISKSYPGVKALDKVSLEFIKGEVHAIIGENGAGKSTLIKLIAGAISPDSGTIIIDGKSFQCMDVNTAKENGIQVMYQEFMNVPSLNAVENVFLGKRTSRGFIVNDKERKEKTKQLFEQLKVSIDLDQPIEEMSPAKQQIVEIVKAISTQVRILIMDEPTAPLTVSEIDMLFRIINDLKKQGVTIIYISHRLEELPIISDRISILRDGCYIKTVNTKDISRRELISLMAGRELKERYPARDPNIGDELLRVENICGNGVKDISFTLHRGEILGLAGLVGSGRTECVQVIYGAAPLEKGALYMNGKKLRLKHPANAIGAGIGMIPEDRKKQGVFLNESIKWNTVINSLKRISNAGIIDSKKEKKIADNYQIQFSIKAPSIKQIVGNLSGGNQQKVVIAKTMAANSEVIIFDEPTRGIDVATKYEIYKLLNELVKSGKGILMISSEMPELIGMCDKIIVLYEGKQNGIVEKEEFRQDHILDLASGSSQL